MSSRAKAAIVAALCALARAGAPAQELPAALPVDVHQVRAIALNPALAAFSGEYLELGVRESYLGISASNLALTAGFMTYAFADPVRGWTLRASHFSASSLRRSRIGAGYGRAPTSWLALGLSADAINLGYHHLDLVDPGDPLFAGGTSRVGYGIGAGLLLRSAAGVELGASVQDLNRPDLSLDPRADARLPARLHGALRLPIGDLILAAGLRDIELGSPGARGLNGAALQLDLAGWVGPWAGLRAFGGNRGAGVEGRLVLPFGMELRYSIEEPFNDLAGFSYGTHQIALVGISEGSVGVPRRRPPPAPPRIGPLPRAPARDAHPRFFFLEPATDSAVIAEVSITRRIDEEVLRQRLPALSPYLGRTLDDLLALRFPTHDFVPLRVADPLAPLLGTYQPRYLGTLADLSHLLAADSELGAAIIACGGSDQRAGSLWSALTGTGALFTDRLPVLAPAASQSLAAPGSHPVAPRAFPAAAEDQLQVDPPALEIDIVSIGMDDFDGPWALVVRDRSGAEVERLAWRGMPRRIVWDWRVAGLDLIAPGRYTFALEWSDGEGRPWASRRRHLTVSRRRQKIDIAVSAGRPAAEPADRVLLFIDEQPDPSR